MHLSLYTHTQQLTGKLHGTLVVVSVPPHIFLMFREPEPQVTVHLPEVSRQRPPPFPGDTCVPAQACNKKVKGINYLMLQILNCSI